MKTINLFDEIGGWYGHNTHEVSHLLREAKGDAVEVVINSPGGSVSEGVAIYNLLRSYEGEVHTRAVGLVASIASIIFLAGDRRTIETGAHYMVHKPSAGLWGEAGDLRHTADILDTLEGALLDIYVERSGVDREAMAAMLESETWMLGAEALEHGFATEVVEGLQAVASAHVPNVHKYFNKVPKSIKNNTTKKAKPKETINMDLQKLKAEHPSVFAEAKAEGAAEAMENVKAHIVMAESSGANDIAFEAIKNNEGLTPSIQAKYLAAGMAKNVAENREEDAADTQDAADTNTTQDTEETQALQVANSVAEQLKGAF